jgi:hypothetical protein
LLLHFVGYHPAPLFALKKALMDRLWGRHKSLYERNGLSPSQVDVLEDSILAYELGRFEEATTKLDDSNLPLCHIVPVLALERFSLYGAQGLTQNQVFLLKKALRSYELWPDKDERVRLLMSLLLQLVDSLLNGNLRLAFKKAEETPRVLAGLPLEGYSGVDVRPGFRIYFCLTVLIFIGPYSRDVLPNYALLLRSLRLGL